MFLSLVSLNVQLVLNFKHNKMYTTIRKEVQGDSHIVRKTISVPANLGKNWVPSVRRERTQCLFVCLSVCVCGGGGYIYYMANRAGLWQISQSDSIILHKLAIWFDSDFNSIWFYTDYFGYILGTANDKFSQGKTKSLN